MISLVRLIVAVLGCLGCGRAHFDPYDDVVASGDVGNDGMTSSTSGLCGIPFGQWTLSPPAALDEINTLLIAKFPANGDREEYDAVFAEDGLTLYFTSNQSGTLADSFQVWQATRPTTSAPFDTVAMLGPDVNATPTGVFGFEPIASLNIAVVSAPYVGSTGMGGDFWLGSNATGTWTWTPTSLSMPRDEIDLRISPDGLTAYVPRDAGGGSMDIYRATRATIAMDFGAAAPVAELNTTASETSPVPVAGGIFIVRAGVNADDIYFAESNGATCLAPYPLDALNSPQFDGEPALFDLGNGECELFFTSTRSGQFNLYRSRVTRL